MLGPPRSDARRKWPFVASLTFQGIPVDIEQKKGDTREGVDNDGTPWKVKMLAHYGEIRRTADTIGAKGMDGDRLDVYVGPDAASPLVVVVDQRIPETGEFDEQKVMLGFSTVADALACYRGQYTKPGFYGGHTTMTIDDLKARMADPSKAGVDIAKALGLAEILASLAGASPEARTRATAQRLLDATWSLAQRAQRYHWNVTGPTFSELHELFGAQYDEANAAVDEIAERMRAMGVRDVSPRPQGAVHPEPGEGATAAAEQVRLLLVAHQEAARIANDLARAAEDAGDAATVDLAGRRALAHEKAAWMLDATMGPDAIAKAKRKQPSTPFIGPKGGKWANESHTRHWSKVDNHDPRAKAGYYAKLRRTQTANAKGTIYTLTKWQAGDHPERVEVAHHPDSGRVHLRFAGRAATHSSHDPADLLVTPDAIIHRTAGVLAKRDGAPEPRLAPLTEAIAKGGNLAAFLGALAGHEIPEFMAHALARNIAKAAHHKYLRRVLTGKTKPRYRYYYTVSGGKGLGHHDEIAVGAAFRMKDSGKDGHFEVKADHGDGHVTIRHDESGTEHKIHKDALAGMLRSEHAEAIQSAADKAKAAALKTLAEARESGSDKHVERAKAEAAKRGASEDETATPEERKAKEAKPEPVKPEPKTGPKADKSRGPTGEHQRVGSHVAGARRDIAGLSREQLADLAPDEAKRLVVKSKVYPFPSESGARDAGWSPGAYALWKHMYNHMATEAPEPGWNMRDRISPEQFTDEIKKNRQEFVDAIDYFAKRFAAARGSATDMIDALKESRDLWAQGRSAGHTLDRTFAVKGGGRRESAARVANDPAARRVQILGDRFTKALEHTATASAWHKDAHIDARNAALAADKEGWPDAPKPKAPGNPKAEPYVFRRVVEDKPSRIGGRPIASADADAMRREFGLHEVDFGHWVSQDDREHHVKWAHSALRDLEDVIGMPSGMASLPQVTKRSGRNTLALAFGARGKGRALAHYEPFARDEKSKVVTPTINLTRFGGGGTLAHEWGHFLDNVLAHAHHAGPDKGSALFLSEGDAANGLPEDVKAPMDKLRGLIASSSFAKHGKTLGEYWGRPHELFARAFEAYVQDKLTDSGRRNSYLVDGTTDRSPTNKHVRPDLSDLRAIDPEIDALRGRLDQLRRQGAHTPESRKELGKVEAEYDAKYQEALRKHFGERQATGHHRQNAQPYPHAVERKKFAAAFDDMFAALRKGRHLEKAMRTLLEAAALRKALHIR